MTLVMCNFTNCKTEILTNDLYQLIKQFDTEGGRKISHLLITDNGTFVCIVEFCICTSE